MHHVLHGGSTVDLELLLQLINFLLSCMPLCGLRITVLYHLLHTKPGR